MTSYWRFLPEVGQLLARDTFPEPMLDLLQSKAMKGYAIVHQVQAEDIYVKEDLAAEGVSEAEFMHANNVVGAYTFGFDVSPGKRMRYMLPVLDAMNYGDPDGVANIHVVPSSDGGFLAVAIRPIDKGEEVLNSYTSACRRNDYSLFHYGFLQHRDPPRLCGLDTLDGTLYVPSSLEEDRDYGEGGILATAEELERLEAILASFPTTEEEDARLLQGRSWWSAWSSKPLGAVERLFIEFRMLRKQALRHAINKVQGVLASPGSQEL